MDLNHVSKENIEYMLEAIKTKLRVANNAVINPDHFHESQYEDIKFIFELVNNKNQFSISEVEAIVAELGNIKK
jgi:uncharacterized protein YfkK (UPF0435 family)